MEKKYSINELEFLAVVWAKENFRNFVYGTEFEVVSDHKALTTILKDNRSNETFSLGLMRWVDRLLPFQFKLVPMHQVVQLEWQITCPDTHPNGTATKIQ